ncbi:acyl carrier protein [Actinosynnema sp. NPDC050436]|uniref:acyl carrier protein n=1 Tax=Actinosynnema sp. NPDC050436 TaxID=3155659 RepID=UPI0033DF27C6
MAEPVVNDEQTEDIRRLIAGLAELAPDSVADDAHFKDDLEMDSLLTMEIAVHLEREYGIRLAEGDLGEITTVRRCADLVRAKQVDR